MAQPKVNRGLVNLGVNFTDVDVSDSYTTQSKSRDNSPLKGTGENNLLPLQTINSGNSEEAVTGATPASSLPSPPKNSSTCMNLSQKSPRMKCYFHHEQNCYLDYFKDPLPDSSVFYNV